MIELSFPGSAHSHSPTDPEMGGGISTSEWSRFWRRHMAPPIGAGLPESLITD